MLQLLDVAVYLFVAAVVVAVNVDAVVAVVAATASFDDFSVTATGHWPLFCCK